MREWAPRSGALLFSLLLHTLALVLLQTRRLPNLDLAEAPPLPVKILERPLPRPARPAPPPARPKPAVPPPAAAPAAPAPPPAPAPPEPEPAAEPPPERKIPLPEQQIVNQPDAGKEVPPPDTRFLSDRDNVVEKQTVKRGEPQPGEEGKQAEASAEKVGERRSRREAPRDPGRQLASLPRLEQLLPSAVQIAREGYGQAEPRAEAAEEASSPKRDRLRSGQAWQPRTAVTGTLDFLPDVQAGDITLLNTKAERFAPFVRRVALRVFQNLLISMRRQIANVRRSTEETVTMEAIMSPGGELVSTNVTARSSSVALASDHLLQQACIDGFFDRNPPAGAESADGQIHFVLRTHVVSIIDSSGQRFGYQISFEVGLL